MTAMPAMTLAAFLSAHVLAQPPQAGQRGRGAQSSSTVSVTQTRTQEGITSYWEISSQRADRLPSWNPRNTPNPPLSSGDAIKVGEDWLRQQNPEVKTFELTNLTLARGYGVFAQSDRWYYMMYFDPVVGGRRLAGGSNFAAVVLLDGSVVEPRIEKGR